MGLSSDQIRHFETEGYVVVPDLIPDGILDQGKAEYADFLNGLYEGWFTDDLVQTPSENLDFWGKLLSAYQAGCDYFQPMDISLPGDRLMENTPCLVYTSPSPRDTQ